MNKYLWKLKEVNPAILSQILNQQNMKFNFWKDFGNVFNTITLLMESDFLLLHGLYCANQIISFNLHRTHGSRDYSYLASWYMTRLEHNWFRRLCQEISIFLLMLISKTSTLILSCQNISYKWELVIFIQS